MDRKIRCLICAVVVMAVVALAGCGGSSSSSSSSGSSSTTEAGSAADGEGSSASFTYGYSIPTGQNPWITTIAKTAQSTASEGGGEGELGDGQLDPGKAVTQINGFLTQGDDVIAAAPAQVPQALQATLSKAVSGGTAAVAIEWSFEEGDPEAPPQAPVQGQVSIDREQLGVEVAEAVNQANPAGAQVIYVGLPYPVSGLDAFEKAMEAHLGKSKLVANLDNPTDNAQGALGPLNGALAANPEADAIVTYNGPSALAAVQAVKSAGLQSSVKIYNVQLDTATAKALEEGTIAASWDINPVELGEALGQMIVAAGTGKPESEWAKTVVIAPHKYTKGNIGSWKDWASSE